MQSSRAGRRSLKAPLAVQRDPPYFRGFCLPAERAARNPLSPSCPGEEPLVTPDVRITLADTADHRESVIG
jgi:hypothetical protein